MMPQWEFLDFLSDEAKKLPAFALRMQANVSELVLEGGRVVGVRGSEPGGAFEIRADLVVGCDGRHSTVRAAAGLAVEDVGAPIDVLWFRISRDPSETDQSLARIGPGHIVVTIDRGDYWQCAFVIPKGGADALRAQDIGVLREQVVKAAPPLASRIADLRSWDDVKLLTVKVDRLTEWSRPGLLCIGDAAHAMSPVGGVGINLAIQDAVATANLLAEKLRDGTLEDDDLDAVRERRLWPTKATQALQIGIQDNVLAPVLSGANAELEVPLPMRLLSSMRPLRRLLRASARHGRAAGARALAGRLSGGGGRARLMRGSAAVASARAPVALVHRDDRLGNRRDRADHADILLPAREHVAARQVEGRVLGVVAGQAQQRALLDAVDEPADVGPVLRAGAHRARLDRRDERAAPELGRREARRRVPRQHRLGVVHAVDVALLEQHGLVVGGDQHRAERMVAGVHRAPRQAVRAFEHRDDLQLGRFGAGVGGRRRGGVMVGLLPDRGGRDDPRLGAEARAKSPASRRHAPPALRCAQPVVRFSITANSSYMIIAIAPITTRPPNARPICIDEPAEISR